MLRTFQIPLVYYYLEQFLALLVLYCRHALKGMHFNKLLVYLFCSISANANVDLAYQWHLVAVFPKMFDIFSMPNENLIIDTKTSDQATNRL